MITILSLVCAQLIGYREPLQGALKHSETLPPLTGMRAISAPSNWFRIPDSFVGGWMEISSSKVYELNELTHSEDTQPHTQNPGRRFVLGWQKDSRGGIWQAEREHSTEPGDKVTERTTAVAGKDDAPLTLRILETVYESPSGKTDTQKVVERRETLEKLAAVEWDPHILVVDFDVQIYDTNGYPTRKFRTLSLFKQTAGFVEKGSEGDKDLQPYFVEFLRQSGFRTLIPEKKNGVGEPK